MYEKKTECNFFSRVKYVSTNKQPKERDKQEKTPKVSYLYKAEVPGGFEPPYAVLQTAD